MKSDSNLEKVLESGKFAVTSELGPPKSADAGNIIKKAQHMKGNADAVNLTDKQLRWSATARSRERPDRRVEALAGRASSSFQR